MLSASTLLKVHISNLIKIKQLDRTPCKFAILEKKVNCRRIRNLVHQKQLNECKAIIKNKSSLSHTFVKNQFQAPMCCMSCHLLAT